MELVWDNFKLNFTNPTDLDDKLYDEFIKSPHIPTTIFIEGFSKLLEMNGHSIGKLFVIKSSTEDKIPKSIIDRCELVDQRSDRWKQLLNYYKCGTNNGVVPFDRTNDVNNIGYIKHYYNLVRGCIIELVAINSNFKQILLEDDDIIDKITVGFLTVEKGVQDSIAIAPDLLLITKNNKIIPVEIKCLHDNSNRNYKRAIKLATKQTKNAMDILKSDIGIILLINISPVNMINKITASYSIIKN